MIIHAGLPPITLQFHPTYPEALFAWLATIAPARELAWDCAAGNGQATLDLVGTSCVSCHRRQPEGRKSTQRRPIRNVEYRVAPAEASGLPGSDGGYDYGGASPTLVRARTVSMRKCVGF